MPPRRGGPPPGPSPGPQDAFSPDRIFPTLLTAAVKLDPTIARLDPQHLRRAFRNKWIVHPPPPGDIEAAPSLLDLLLPSPPLLSECVPSFLSISSRSFSTLTHFSLSSCLLSLCSGHGLSSEVPTWPWRAKKLQAPPSSQIPPCFFPLRLSRSFCCISSPTPPPEHVVGYLPSSGAFPLILPAPPNSDTSRLPALR